MNLTDPLSLCLELLPHLPTESHVRQEWLVRRFRLGYVQLRGEREGGREREGGGGGGREREREREGEGKGEGEGGER